MKSRGMVHSTDLRKFNISSKGIALIPLITTIAARLANSKRSFKEHENLSTSKGSKRVEGNGALMEI